MTVFDSVGDSAQAEPLRVANEFSCASSEFGSRASKGIPLCPARRGRSTSALKRFSVIGPPSIVQYSSAFVQTSSNCACENGLPVRAAGVVQHVDQFVHQLDPRRGVEGSPVLKERDAAEQDANQCLLHSDVPDE